MIFKFGIRNSKLTKETKKERFAKSKTLLNYITRCATYVVGNAVLDNLYRLRVDKEIF